MGKRKKHQGKKRARVRQSGKQKGKDKKPFAKFRWGFQLSSIFSEIMSDYNFTENKPNFCWLFLWLNFLFSNSTKCQSLERRLLAMASL